MHPGFYPEVIIYVFAWVDKPQRRADLSSICKDRDAHAYVLNKFKDDSASFAELTDGLRDFFQTEVFIYLSEQSESTCLDIFLQSSV